MFVCAWPSPQAVWELVIVLLGMERSGPRVQLGSPDPQVMMAFLELKEREDGQGSKEGQVPEAYRYGKHQVDAQAAVLTIKNVHLTSR